MARRALDQYYTSESAIKALLNAYPDVRGGRLGDPACGDGRMARMLMQAGHFDRVFLNDINPAVVADSHMDAMEWLRGPGAGCCWQISNPPFFAAGDIVRACLETAKAGVAMLLRCTFLEPCGPSHACRKEVKAGKKRRPAIPCSPDRCLRNGRRWLIETPPTRILSIPRISFTGDGQSDSAPAWWFAWLRGADGAWLRGTIRVVERPTGQLGLELGGG